MGTLTSILTILGIVGPAIETGLPIIEKLFGGLMTYASQIAAQLFGANAAQKMDDIKAEADGVVANIEADAAGAVSLITGLAPDIQSLLTLFPGLAQQLAAEYNVMKGQSIPRSLATTVVKAAHSDLKVAQGTTKA